MSPALLELPAGLYRGRVYGAESGRCEARMSVSRIPGGCVAIDYEAVGADGLQHAEHTIAAPGFLYVAHSEANGVQVFRESAPGVFDGPGDGAYRLRLIVGWDGEELSWSWHWARTDQDLHEQSRAILRIATG